MKICFLTASMRAGGAERVMSILANEFCKRGHDVSFIVTDDAKIIAYKLDEKVVIKYADTITLRSISGLLSCSKSIDSCVKELKPDVVITFFQSVIIPWLMTGNSIPLIFSERNDPKNNNTGFMDRLMRVMVMHKAKGIVFQTKRVQNFFRCSIRKKSTVIMNPFDASKLPQRDTNKRVKEIVAVGRLTQQKNYNLLLEAFVKVYEKHPDYCLRIYGVGPLKDELINNSIKLKISDAVHFMGVSNDVLNAIKNSSCYVLSSNYEGIPNALLEALALGLPCVTTDYLPEAVDEFVDNYINGVIVPRNNPQKMADAINEIIEDDEFAQLLGEKASEIVATIRVEKIAKEWMRFIQSKLREGESVDCIE